MNSKPSRSFSTQSRLRLRFLPAWALLAVTSAMLGGCSSLIPQASPDTTRYFVLSNPVTAQSGVTKAGGRLQIGLRPVELPAYLRSTKSMVVRDGGNEIRYQDFSRWAEPLEAGVNRVLKERLLASSEVAGVVAHPMRGDVMRDFDVTVRIVHCEGSGGVAKFSASYDIVSTTDGGKAVASKTFAAPESAWDGKDFGELARLLSEGVAALSERIVADLPR